jgi:predicted ATPase
MLTRIEIDGFKTFEGFHLDLGPFLVVLGPNACGKSNLFDAIRLLSHLAGTDLRTAVKEMRGEPHELFRRQADGSPGKTLALAVEVLLDPVVRDPWGATVGIKHPRLRYEVTVERRKGPREIERLVVVHEKAAAIPAREDRWLPGRRGLSPAFKKAFVRRPGGTRTPFLETVRVEGKASFQIHADGHAGRTRSAEAAEATVLSSITSAEFPHLYALREELRSWRFLQLDPVAMRRPSPTNAPEQLEPGGANLATVLARIQAETATPERPKGVIADIAADLASLIAGAVDLSVTEDAQGREYRLDVQMRGGPPFSSRVISDGTLRVLALLALLHDPRYRGLVCLEEPENGVHPFRLRSLIERLRELLSDPASAEVDKAEPLSQMLLNSHSPVVLSCLREGEMVFADVVTTVNPQAREVTPKTRVRPVQPDDQGEFFAGDGREFVTRYEVNRYLGAVDRGV